MNSIAFNFLLISAIYSLLLVSGFSLSLLFKLKNENSSFRVAFALTTIFIIAWYLKDLFISLGNLFVIFFVLNTLFFIINYKKINIKINDLLVVLPIFFFSLLINFLITKQLTLPFITFGNNDVYNWSITADTLLGLPGYRNVIPEGPAVYKTLLMDGFGSQVLLSIFSYFNREIVIEVIPEFYIFISSISALAIYEIVKKTTTLGILNSYLISFIFLLSPFYIYIIYQGFIGQQIAIFFFIVGILSAIEIEKIPKIVSIVFFKKFLIFLIPVIGILISYQSSFIIYFIHLIILLLILNIINKFNNFSNIIKFSATLLLICFIALPQVFFYTIERTIYVGNINAGWPFDFISPLYFYITSSSLPFPGFPSNIFVFNLFIIAIIAILLFSRFLKLEITNDLKSIAFLFLISLILYEFAYFSIGSKYQVWKYLSYTALPLSFVFSCILFTYLGAALKNHWPKILCSIIFLFPIIFAIKIYKTNFVFTNYDSSIKDFKKISNFLANNPEKNIVLGTGPFSETMLAFNIFSANYKNFSLSQTYIPPANPSLIDSIPDNEKFFLVPRACFDDSQLFYYADEWALLRSIEFPAIIKFSSVNINCNKFNGLFLGEGFSSPEPWGVWTLGNRAAFNFKVPSSMIGHEIRIELQLKSYSPQKVSIFSGDSLVSNLGVVEDGFCTFNVNASSAGDVKLRFFVSDPKSPSTDLSNPTGDNRVLGIGLVGLKMMLMNN